PTFIRYQPGAWPLASGALACVAPLDTTSAARASITLRSGARSLDVRFMGGTVADRLGRRQHGARAQLARVAGLLARVAGLLASVAGLLARGRTRTRRRLARPPPGRAQTCARADEIACAVRGEGRARLCSDEGAAQLRRPGGGCAWRGPPLRSRVELHRHRALPARAPRGIVPRGTELRSGEGSPTPRGVVPRGTAQGSGESSIDPRGPGLPSRDAIIEPPPQPRHSLISSA